ncbi:unnamed protein product [Cuscuta campestris]|uniref:Uncharacterized protein n=1 Tax=Cuscuta campestris TaxID=132261 RepID=A0A484NGX2_9ASTE|nr:unnamed protein product [Cuscuta campestris]
MNFSSALFIARTSNPNLLMFMLNRRSFLGGYERPGMPLKICNQISNSIAESNDLRQNEGRCYCSLQPWLL